MEKLPHRLHYAFWAIVSDDVHPKSIMGHRFGCIELIPVYITEDGRLTDLGKQYRRKYLPTEEEQIEDLRAEFDALVKSTDALIDEKEDEIYRMRNLLLWAQNVINDRGFLTSDQQRLVNEIKDVLTAPDDVSIEGDVDE